MNPKLPFQMPTQQVFAGGIGALLVYLAIQAVRYFYGFDLGAAQDTAIEGAATLLIAHITPPSAVDIVKRINDDIALAGTYLGKLTAKSDSSQPMTSEAKLIATKAE